MAKMKVGVLISGRGTNLQALARAAIDPDYPAEIALVISNRPNVDGITFAMDEGLPFAVIDHTEFDSREAHERAMTEQLKEVGVELICLAGYMRIVSDDFINDWRGKILNIHPSLLPALRGVDTHERALERGVRIHGCTVHFVNSELDGGPIVSQGALAVQPNDTAETLGARVLELEHQLYPRALEMIANKSIRWSGDDGVLDVDVSTDDVAVLSSS